MVNTVNQKESAPPLSELGIEKIAEVKNVVEYRLENGLKVLLMENHTAPVITFLVLYKVGSRNEAVGFTGATHFLEHMLFKGTKKLFLKQHFAPVSEFIELAQADGKTIFIVADSIVKFCEHGTTPEPEKAA